MAKVWAKVKVRINAIKLALVCVWSKLPRILILKLEEPRMTGKESPEQGSLDDGSSWGTILTRKS